MINCDTDRMLPSIILGFSYSKHVIELNQVYDILAGRFLQKLISRLST